MIPVECLPREYRQTYFVAGGFVACPALATDVDIWVPVHDTMDHTRAQLENHLLENRSASLLSEVHHLKIAATPAEQQEYPGVMAVEIQKIATFRWGAHSKPYHLMITDSCIEGVLANFDISTHQIAWSPEFGLVPGVNFTPITDPPAVLMNTPHTPGRLAKIKERYGI